MTQAIQENVTVNILSRQDSLAVKRVLDVVCSILAEEYITVAKQNQGVFNKIASPSARNDTK